MSPLLPRQNTSISARPARDVAPKRLIVTASVVTFAIRDWSLWVLLRDGPWGPPMRLVQGAESVAEAVERTLEALLLWPAQAPLVQLKAGWQEQQVYVWGSTEQGSAISLVHSMLLRSQRDELRPNLRKQPIPSLHVQWVPINEVESGQRTLDADVRPALLTALHALRSQIQYEPDLVLRYLADMVAMRLTDDTPAWWQMEPAAHSGRNTLPLNVIKEPPAGNGTLTMAEATLLYRAFFPPDEQIDLPNLRRRFLGTNRLEALDEERPVRGRETDRRRVSRAYLYKES
ncbi:MAG TPA: hypothetical protein VGN34_16855 [Ktedonobacteraceae bacterium]